MNVIKIEYVYGDTFNDRNTAQAIPVWLEKSQFRIMQEIPHTKQKLPEQHHETYELVKGRMRVMYRIFKWVLKSANIQGVPKKYTQLQYRINQNPNKDHTNSYTFF